MFNASVPYAESKQLDTNKHTMCGSSSNVDKGVNLKRANLLSRCSSYMNIPHEILHTLFLGGDVVFKGH